MKTAGGVNNTIYVDTKYGNDSTASPERKYSPYNSITRALEAAKNRFPKERNPWNIVIAPGHYRENLKLEPYVNIQAEGPVILEGNFIGEDLNITIKDCKLYNSSLIFTSLSSDKWLLLQNCKLLNCQIAISGLGHFKMLGGSIEYQSGNENLVGSTYTPWNPPVDFNVKLPFRAIQSSLTLRLEEFNTCLNNKESLMSLKECPQVHIEIMSVNILNNGSIFNVDNCSSSFFIKDGKSNCPLLTQQSGKSILDLDAFETSEQLIYSILDSDISLRFHHLQCKSLSLADDSRLNINGSVCKSSDTFLTLKDNARATCNISMLDAKNAFLICSKNSFKALLGIVTTTETLLATEKVSYVHLTCQTATSKSSSFILNSARGQIYLSGRYESSSDTVCRILQGSRSVSDINSERPELRLHNISLISTNKGDNKYSIKYIPEVGGNPYEIINSGLSNATHPLMGVTFKSGSQNFDIDNNY